MTAFDTFGLDPYLANLMRLSQPATEPQQPRDATSQLNPAPTTSDRTMRRAAESLATVPQMTDLTSMLAELTGNVGDTPLPPNFGPGNTPPPPPSEPRGPGGDPNSTFFFTGLSNFFDYLGRITAAPNYIGRYRDPATGITYDTQGRDITEAPRTLSSILPELAIADPLFWKRVWSDAPKIQQKYGISPSEQLTQSFDAPTAAAALRQVTANDVAGTFRGAETAATHVAGTALEGIQTGVGTGVHIMTAGPGNLMAIPDAIYRLVTSPTTFLESVRQTPGVEDDVVRSIRKGYLEAAADRTDRPFTLNLAGGIVDPVQNALFSSIKPAMLAIGRVPITDFGKWGAQGLAKASPVSFVKESGPIANFTKWTGTSLFERTDLSKAHLARRNATDLMTGLMKHTELDDLDVIGFSRELRNFLNTPDLTTLGEWYVSDPYIRETQGVLNGLRTQKAGKETVDLIGKHLDSWIALSRDSNITIAQVVEDITNIVYDNTRAQLAKGQTPPGPARRIFQGVGAMQDWAGAIWRPFTLLTRSVYVVNNFFSSVVNELWQHGPIWNELPIARSILTDEGYLDGPAAPQYIREGIARNPASLEHIRSIPLIGNIAAKAMTPVSVSNDAVEQLGKQVTFGVEMYRGLIDQSQKIVATLPEQAQTVLAGAIGANQVKRRLDGLARGVVDWADHVNYAYLQPTAGEKFRLALDRQHRLRGGALTVDDVLAAGQEAIEHIKREGLVKGAAAMHDEPTGFEVFKLYSTRYAKQNTPEYQAFAAKANQYESARRTRDLAFRERSDDYLVRAVSEANKSGVTDLDPVQNQASLYTSTLEQLRQEWLGRWEKGLHSKVCPLYQDAIKFREEAWAETGNPLKVSQKVDENWKRTYAAHDSILDEFERVNENIHIIINEALTLRWSPKKAQDTLEQYMTNGETYVPSDATIKAMISSGQRVKNPVDSISFDRITELALEAGFTKRHIPGQMGGQVDYVTELTDRDVADLQKLLNSFQTQADYIKQYWRVGGQTAEQLGRNNLPLPDDLATKLGGVSPAEIIDRFQQRGLIARDSAAKVAGQVQFDRATDTRNIDRMLGYIFPFEYWTTRNTIFTVKQAIRNPYQASLFLRLLHNWHDANKDRPWYDRFSMHIATLDPGTDHEMQVRFNPTALVFPMGFQVLEVMRAANKDDADALETAGSLVKNFFGGAMYPWVPVLASQLGMNMEGGPPKSAADVVKGLTPQLTLGRHAATALPGLQGQTLGLLTESEKDQVIRAITDDVNLGRVPKSVGAAAAGSIAQGKPNQLATQYLQTVAPKRLASTVTRQAIGPFSTESLGQQTSRYAFQALKESRTEAERQYVYQQFPGLQINIGGKRGDERELAIINSSAPSEGLGRSWYYQLHSERIDQLVARIAATKGEDIAGWRLKTASPESFEAFRLAGGSQVVPELAGYWFQGKDLSTKARTVLADMYQKNGMGALTYKDWRDRILQDAYVQWVGQNQQRIRQLRTNTR